MKKWIVLACAGLLVSGLAACGDGGKSDNGTESGESVMQESTGVAESPVLEETGEAGAASGEAGMDENLGGWSREMQALRDAVVEELGEDYWPNMEIPAEALEMNFGLTADMYEDYMGEMPMMSTHVDTLLIVKAKEGQADMVEETLEAYRTDLVENSLQYPMNMGKVQAAMVGREGDYVSFVLLGGDLAAVEEEGDEAVIAYCKEQNQRVMDIIAQNTAR